MVAKNPIKLDPDDGLVIGEVGQWAIEKHDRLRKYIDAAGPTRAKFVPPKGRAAASYIELYCGAGRSLIKGTRQIIDGSALVAYHETVDQVLRTLNPYGLHLAFLDPFSLGQLPFSIIEKMLKFRRMDMIVHVSLQDLQRNLDDYSSVGDPTLDNFAPGWRNAIDPRQAIAPLRAALIKYWMRLIRSLGSKPATGIPLIVGEKNQRLYWLVFLSSNPHGHKLWNDVQNLKGQRTLFD